MRNFISGVALMQERTSKILSRAMNNRLRFVLLSALSVALIVNTVIAKSVAVDFRGMDTHGSGATRGDFKSGNPSNYPRGLGPQRDEVRIKNYVRCVRKLK